MGKVYNRKTNEIIEESQYKNNSLLFLYNNPFGRLILKVLVLPFISKVVGKYFDSKGSTKKVKSFIKDNNIDMSLYEKKEFESFNDFFARKKILSDDLLNSFNDKSTLISPADSRVLLYKFDNELKVKIKDSVYDIAELTKMPLTDLQSFKNGNVFIFRLCVDDYHRYCYIDDGEVVKQTNIKGILHTVSSISNRYKIYKENHRVVSVLKANNLGECIYIEVGALLVGKIVNNNLKSFNKGEEKGFFKFGGSTIVVITKDNVIVDEDILNNSKNDIETKVSYGEKIGIINKE